MKKKNILVVDGSALRAMELEKQLRSLGYSMSGHAQSSEAALAWVALHQVDAVIVARHLPGNLDLEVLLYLLQGYYHLPVILRLPAGEKYLQDGPLCLLDPYFDGTLAPGLAQVACDESWPPASFSSLCRFIKGSDQATLMVKPSGELLYMNAAAERMLGVRLEQWAGHELDEVLQVTAPESQQAWMSIRQEAMDCMPESAWRPCTIDRPGRETPVEASAQCISLAGDQQVVAWRLRHRPIDVCAEVQSLDTPDLARLLIRLLPQGLALVDPNQTILDANEHLLHMLACERQDVIGRQLAELFTAATRPAPLLLQAVGKQPQVEAELELLAADHRARTVHLHATRLAGPDAQSAGAAVMISDSSASKGIMKVLAENERMAAVGAMTGGLLHEVNNALAVMVGHLDLIQKEGPLNPRQQAQVAQMAGTTEQLSAMMRRLRIIERPSRPTTSVLGLHLVVNDALRRICASWLTKEIDISLDLDEIVLVSGDREQLADALVPILENAADAVSMMPSRHIDIAVGSDGADGYIRVTDTGCGFDAEQDLSRLLLPFVSRKGAHAVKGSLQHVMRGAGLGLSISNSIVRDHQGRITLAAGDNGGAVVTMRLPQAVVAEPSTLAR